MTAFIETISIEKGYGTYKGIVCPVSNKNDVDDALNCLIVSKTKFEAAYCYAYKIAQGKKSGYGENKAIGCDVKLLRLLDSLDISYCLLIVLCDEKRKLHPCERVGRVLKAARKTLKKCVENEAPAR